MGATVTDRVPGHFAIEYRQRVIRNHSVEVSLLDAKCACGEWQCLGALSNAALIDAFMVHAYEVGAKA